MSIDDIKSVYRQKALELHPDKSSNVGDEFVLLQEEYNSILAIKKHWKEIAEYIIINTQMVSTQKAPTTPQVNKIAEEVINVVEKATETLSKANTMVKEYKKLRRKIKK